MSIPSIRDQFVPEDGISRAVLEDNLTAYFPRGAKIEKKIQLGKDGEVGWFIGGGRVTDNILKSLREETQRRERRDQRAVELARAQRAPLAPNQQPRQTTVISSSQRVAPTYAPRPEEGRHGALQPQIASYTAPETGQTRRQEDRHAASIDSPARPFLPERWSSLLPPPDIDDPYSPEDMGRYQPTDAIDMPGQSRQLVARSAGQPSQNSSYSRHDRSTADSHLNKPNMDPAYAAKHPERDFSLDDFDSFTRFSEFLRLKQMYEEQQTLRSPFEGQERSRKHQDDRRTIASPLPLSPPPYQFEETPIRPPRHESLREARRMDEDRGRDEDDDEDKKPIYGQNRPTYGSRQSTDRSAGVSGTNRIGRDDDDENPNLPGPYGHRMDLDDPDGRSRARREESPTDRSERNERAPARKSGDKRYHGDKSKGGRPQKFK